MTKGPSDNEPTKLNAVNVMTNVLTGEIKFFFRINMTKSVALTTMLHVNKIIQYTETKVNFQHSVGDCLSYKSTFLSRDELTLYIILFLEIKLEI